MDKGKFHLQNLFFLLLFLIAGNLNGQVIEIDSTSISEVEADEEEIHSPRKAAIYSAILPGLGQAYNKKYWKIPLVYIGFGGIGYFIKWNNDFYKTYKQAYSDLTDGDENSNSFLDLEAAAYFDLDNSTDYNNFKTGLSKQQAYYRRNRDLLIISTVAFYGLNIIDASVDAHFFNFDISEDLTFNWQPAMNNYKNHLVYGVNCSFNF